jgi:D-hydroxyproline dehydrogenase
MGASYGNAGTIADYATSPVGTPDVLRRLPSLLFRPHLAACHPPPRLARAAPWLLRFLRQSLPAQAARNAAVSPALLTGAGEMWDDLALRVQRRGHPAAPGLPLPLRDPEGLHRMPGCRHGPAPHLGVEVDLVGPDRLAELEPSLPPGLGGAAFFTGATFLDDPGRMMGLIAAAVTGQGPTSGPGPTGWTRPGRRGDRGAGPAPACPPGGPCRRGAFPGPCTARPGTGAPGHRARLSRRMGHGRRRCLSRPTCPTARGFYFCPMAGRLRVAGTVELGGLTLPPSPHRHRQSWSKARGRSFPTCPPRTVSGWAFARHPRLCR